MGRFNVSPLKLVITSGTVTDFDELFDAMGCNRDRALLEFFVSSGARAAELLGVGPEDVDWTNRQIYVISKRTRERQAIPASPQSFVRRPSTSPRLARPCPASRSGAPGGARTGR